MSHYDNIIEYFQQMPVKDSVITFTLNRANGVYYRKGSDQRLAHKLEYKPSVIDSIVSSFWASRPEIGRPSERNIPDSVRRLCLRLESELVRTIKNKKLKLSLRKLSDKAFVRSKQPEFINYAIEILESKTLDQKSREHLIERLFIKTYE